MKELIFNAEIINRGRRFRGFVTVDDAIIAKVRQGTPSAADLADADVRTDLEGAWLLPGVIDTHVHFRDGGDASSPKGNFATESAAALAGGVTTVFDMPNTSPAAVSRAAIGVKAAHAAECSAVNHSFFIGATPDNFSELAAADYTRTAGVKIFLGASTGNMLVEDNNVIRRIFSDVDAVKAVHAENQHLLERNLGLLRKKYDGGAIPIYEHPAWRDREVCLSSTEKAIRLAEETGARLHICHISTAEETALFRSGDVKDKRITAETCPQYLWFGGREDYIRLGARIKCNPAIKEKSDAEALLQGIIEGRIDTVATDHAPHLLSDKEGDLTEAASGMPGIQFSLRLMAELSLRNPALTLERVAEVMCHNPATIFGIDRRGFIDEGMYADLVCLRECEPYAITDSDVRSLCGWTPYAGITLGTEIVRVWVNGRSNHSEPVLFNK